MSSSSGRQAVFATDSALNGKILNIPAPSSALPFLALNASAAPAPLSIYFINGWMNTSVAAGQEAAALQALFGQGYVSLAYNHSYVEPNDYEIGRCIRSLGGAAAGSAVCKVGDKTVGLLDSLRGGMETLEQQAGIQSASELVAVDLIAQAERDLAAGGAVVIVGHSQGTLFAQSILKQLNDWWARRSTGCAKSSAAPVGALYISPAFHPTSNYSPVSSERYVELGGDALGVLHLAPAPTALPGPNQGSNPITLHEFNTYMAPGSASRQQISDNFSDLADAARSRAEDCSAAPASATPAPLQDFYNECKADAGSVALANGLMDDRLPTTESGWKCDEKGCFIFLTYSGRNYKGGQPGCPEQALVPTLNPVAVFLNGLVPTPSPFTLPSAEPSLAPITPQCQPGYTYDPADQLCHSNAPAPPPNPVPAGTITITHVAWDSACVSADPLPGWKNCRGTVTLSITRTIPSGIVSVYFNYPDDGSFYHGQLPVGPGIPGTVTVTVDNQYESHCVTSFPTTIDVRDGPTTNGAHPLLASIPITLTKPACP